MGPPVRRGELGPNKAGGGVRTFPPSPALPYVQLNYLDVCLL